MLLLIYFCHFFIPTGIDLRYQIICIVMKPLETAFKQQAKEQPHSHNKTNKNKQKNAINKWTFDPDFIENSSQKMTTRLEEAMKNCLKNKLNNEKYLEEQTYVQLINELTSSLKHLPTQMDRLVKIEEVLLDNHSKYFGQQKNMIKHFESVLDAKIRKLKKKGRRSQLKQYDDIVKKEIFSKRNNKKICYIDEEENLKNRRQHAEKYFANMNDLSKASFGTLNSGSNQNDSISNKNKSGSRNKSTEGNALAVLLANFQKPIDKKHEKDKQKQKYDFSSVFNASLTIRQRQNTSKMHETLNPKHAQHKGKKQISDDDIQFEQKDEAFIFHRPKYNKKYQF